MGFALSKIWNRFFAIPHDVRILMVGLDAAGKTTLLYRLKLGEVMQTIPTIGFNVESVSYKHINFTVWDIGGQDVIRPLWRHYFSETQGLIFVVDSNDPTRLPEAYRELKNLIDEDQLRNVPVVVLANKQDLPGALSSSEIAQRMQLYKLLSPTRKWLIQAICATNGTGVFEAFDWLSNNIT